MQAVRASVKMDTETIRLVQNYSRKTGVPMIRVIAQAVSQWLKTKGAVTQAILRGENDGKAKNTGKC